MGLHKNIPYTCNHIAHSLEYANAAARTGATGLTVDDVGRIAMQLDNDSFWILQDHSPLTWCPICGGVDDLNGLTGSLNLIAGPNITINSGSGEIVISGTDSGNHTTVNTFSGTVTLTAGDDINIINNSGDIAISSTFVESADVDSLNEFTGDVTISAGTNVTVNSGSNDIKISASFVESADVDSLNSLQGALTLDAGPNIIINAGGTSIAISGTDPGNHTTVNTFSGTVTLTAGDDINIVNDNGDIAISSTFAESADVDSLNEFTGDVNIVAGPNIAIASGSNEIVISGTVTDTDVKVKVSSNDTTADFLYNKLVAGPDITLTEANDGGDEKIVISGTFTDSADVDSLNALQGVVTVTAGPNITVNTAGQDISITGSSAGTSADLATVHTTRTIDFGFSASFVDVPMDYTALENNPLIVEHDNVNTERINILETGLYMVSYATTIDMGSDDGEYCLRVYKDSLIQISGSYAGFEDDSPGDRWHTSNTFTVEVSSGSYLTLQVRGPPGATTPYILSGCTNFNVTRMQGTQGNSGSQGPPGEDTDVNGFSGSVSIVAGPNIAIASGSNEIVISGTVTDTDVKVKVTTNDTTADFLYDKLVAGPDIVITEANDGGNEKVVISSSFVESADVDTLNGFTGAVTVSAGTNVTVNSVANDIKVSASFVESADVDSLNAVQGAVTITAGPNITVNTAGQDISITGSAAGGGGLEFETLSFFADQFDSPVNSDWAVNALAPAGADPANNALVVRVFDDSSHTGVGFSAFIPSGSTNIILRFRGRAQTSPSVGPDGVAFNFYNRGIPDNAAVESWSGITEIDVIQIPTAGAYFQYDETTISLSSLSIETEKLYQFELVRDYDDSYDDLSGNYLLFHLEVGFS